MRVIANPKFLIGILISAGLVWYLAVSTDWSVVFDEFQNLRWQGLLLGIVVLLGHQAIRAYRWRFFLPKENNVPVMTLWDGMSIGNLANHILPLRAGEFLRPLVLTQQKLAPFGVAFTSVLIERFFDLSAVLFLFSFAFPKNQSPILDTAVYSFTVLASAILVGLLAAAFLGVQLRKLTAWFAGYLPGKLSGFAVRLGNELIDGAVVLRSPSRVVAILILTVLVWGSACLHFYVWQMLFEVEPSFTASVITLLCVALAVALPSAPGFVGVFQIACVLGLHEISKFSQPFAVAFSLTMHAMNYLFYFIAGGISLSRTRFSLSKASSVSSSLASEAEVVPTRN